MIAARKMARKMIARMRKKEGARMNAVKKARK